MEQTLIWLMDADGELSITPWLRVRASFFRARHSLPVTITFSSSIT